MQQMGMRLRDARKRAGYTREGAAERANRLLPQRHQGLAPVTITRYENGSIKEPSTAVLVALAQVYGARLDEISPELAEDAAAMASLLSRACAPWDSNPEPADSEQPHLPLCFADAA